MKSAKEKVYDNIYGENSEITYDSSTGFSGFLYKKLSRYETTRYQVTYSLLPQGTERLLDVGCGNGTFMLLAKDKVKECYGVDVSPARIEQAKRRIEARQDEKSFKFFSCDFDQGTSFPDSFFDVVTCTSVLEHVFNPPTTIDEIYRLLKPNGVFIVQVPNYAWVPFRFQLMFGKLPVTGGVYLGTDWEHLHNFTKSSLNQLLVAKHFQVESLLCTGIFAKIRRLWVSGLGGDLVVKCIARK
jgi:ubiquinone/menaquinone biosynthesis C-methylase UbiE